MPTGLAMSIPSWKSPQRHSNPDVKIPVVGADALGVASLILPMSDVILFLTSGFVSVCVSILTTESSDCAFAGAVVVSVVAIRAVQAMRFLALFFMVPFLRFSSVTLLSYQIVMFRVGFIGVFL